jgi:lipopolysaccharide export system protein LptA
MRIVKKIVLAGLSALVLFGTAGLSIGADKPKAQTKESAKDSSKKTANGKKDDGKKAGSKKPITIVADRMDSDSEKNKSIVIFTGNVVAEEDFILCSDFLTVRYGDNKEISEIDAKGNVVILKEGRTAVSETMHYNKGTRVVVLIGNAIVKQVSNTVVGDKVSLNLDEEKATVVSEKGGRVKVVLVPENKDKESPKEPVKIPGADLLDKVAVAEARCTKAHADLK